MKRIITTVALILICFLAIWLRFPRIQEGMPYLLKEDEAHHFNRIVEMVKSGDLNPHYFHKPSLHFYLRIPVVAASFIWAVREGHIRSVKEIITRDNYGVGEYAFSASHAGIVKWNRAFSVFLSLMIVLLAFFIATELTSSNGAGLVAATLTALSPALIEDSATIGVDIVMSFVCLACIYCGLRLYKNFSLQLLSLCGLLAGLALSSKYNALPIALLPLFVCALSKRFDFKALALAIIMPAVGFILGTPYAIVSLPLFLDQMAYEVWHYGIAAHEGHNAEPGWPQAMFYLSWLNKEALGPVATAFGIIGVLILFVRKCKSNLIFLLFPALFSILMIEQRTNFTRNMLVVVPCIAVIAAIVLDTLVDFLEIKNKWRYALFASFLLAACYYPAQLALKQRDAALNYVDSRLSASVWLLNNKLEGNSDTAIAGQLQLPQSFFNQAGLTRINQNDWSATKLYMAGFDRLLTAPGFKIKEDERSLLSLEQTFDGDEELKRIVVSPRVNVYALKADEAALERLRRDIADKAEFHLSVKLTSALNDKDSTTTCSYGDSTAKTPSENLCWITSRISFIKIDGLENANLKAAADGNVELTVQLQSPWPSQNIQWSMPNWKWDSSLVSSGMHEVELSVPYKNLMETKGLFVTLSKVLSPESQGSSGDERRLGIGLKAIKHN